MKLPLGVKKQDFFQNVPNLGEPSSLISKSFLSLDTTKYLEDLTLQGNLFSQFTDEAQKFDFRYNIKFDAQYAYSYTGNVSGKITNFPSGASPFDYVVDVFVFTDQSYFIESVPITSNWTFTTLAGTNKGNKICHLTAIENVITVGGGGEVTSFGTVLAEDYVTQPTEGYRLPRSYNVDPNHSAFEQLKYRSFGYDVSATIVALISMNEETYAEKYCLAMLKTQQRQQTDDGGNTTNQTNTDRLPFSSFLHNPQFLIDPYHRTGAEMWQAGAWLHFAKKYPSNSNVTNILNRTQDLLVALYNQEYVISNGLQNGCFRGGKGAYITDLDTENNQLVYLGFDPDYSVNWCANEHNVDAYFTLKEAENNANFPDKWNAFKKINSNLGTACGKNTLYVGNCCVQNCYNTEINMGLGTKTPTATQFSNDISLGGMGVFINTGQYAVKENSSSLIFTGITPNKGDIVTIERSSLDNKFRLYVNSILIHTSTYTNSANMNINFYSNAINTRMDKIQSWNDLLINYSYYRTYPVTSFSVINSGLTQNITDDLRASVQTALQSNTVFYDSIEKRGNRGISQDIYSGITGLTRNAGANGWIGGGVSVARLKTGELHDFSYLVDNLTTAKIAGFSFNNGGEHFGDIDFGWELNNGVAYVAESGTRKTAGETVAINDKLSMVIDTSNNITYYINGVLKYSSAVTPTFDLLIDCSIWNNTASITKCVLDNQYMPWETGASLVNCVEISETLSGLLDTCHALDNMTWYALARYDMGDTTEADACVDYVINGGDGSYSTYDGFYSAVGLVPYIPNNGCYQTPLTQSLMWTEGMAGYVMALKAKGEDATAKTNLKEVAKVSRIDGIPYVTKSDNIYELQDWGCLIASAWVQIANKPNGWWNQNYTQILTGNGL